MLITTHAEHLCFSEWHSYKIHYFSFIASSFSSKWNRWDSFLLKLSFPLVAFYVPENLGVSVAKIQTQWLPFPLAVAWLVASFSVGIFTVAGTKYQKGINLLWDMDNCFHNVFWWYFNEAIKWVISYTFINSATKRRFCIFLGFIQLNVSQLSTKPLTPAVILLSKLLGICLE